ncbi:MAG: hypothetical protein OXF79_12430 [Chloroflexi bacterium]|nr:hypothetical protein [Chloroflexota bacterium]
MPIPIIPIVAALGAGAIGYYIGRKTAGHSMEDSSTSVFLCGDFGNANKDEAEDAESPAGTQAPEEEIDEVPRGA